MLLEASISRPMPSARYGGFNDDADLGVVAVDRFGCIRDRRDQCRVADAARARVEELLARTIP